LQTEFQTEFQKRTLASIQAPVSKDNRSELQHWKSTYRTQFAITLIASAVLCIRVLFPMLLEVSFTGTIWEEAGFVLMLWLLSSLIIGTTVVAVSLLTIMQALKKTETGDGGNGDGSERDGSERDGSERVGLDRASLATDIFTGNGMRLLMSLSPCIGPPISLAVISNFYRAQILFPDAMTLAKGCALLALVSFVVCLPLTLYAQKTLKARVQEKFNVDISE